MEPVGDFKSFANANPTKAQELIAKVVEVTGVDDQQLLYKAFDQSKKSHHTRDYNVTHAIGNISNYFLSFMTYSTYVLTFQNAFFLGQKIPSVGEVAENSSLFLLQPLLPILDHHPLFNLQILPLPVQTE